MALREEIERSGNWLFRWRSYLPLLLFVPVLLGLRHFTYPEGRHELDLAWEAVCLAVSLAGLAVRVVTIGHTPAGTSGRNTGEGQVAATLNTTGLYSLVRHPLYLGNYLMWLGVALFPRAAWVALAVSAAFWLYYERIMFAEEEFLRRRFGAAFEAWAARTPAFLPRPFGARAAWVSPALPFSWRNVLRREYSGLFGLIASFTLCEVVGDAAVQGRLHADAVWVALFGASAAAYVTLRFLKRRTGVLHVAGR